MQIYSKKVNKKKSEHFFIGFSNIRLKNPVTILSSNIRHKNPVTVLSDYDGLSALLSN